MKRRQAPYGKRKPIVQLDDGPRASFGLGFKKESEGNQMSPAMECEDMSENQSNFNEGDQEVSNSQEAKGLIQFVKSKETFDEMDSKLSDFLAEIDAIDIKPTTTNKIVEEIKANPLLKEPIAPTTVWQAVFEDSSQCYYYWNMETNVSVWEMPPEYTQFLAQYKEYEQEYSEYTKELNNRQKIKNQDKRQQVLTEKSLKAVVEKEGSSASLVPYESMDESMEDSIIGPVVNGMSGLAKTCDYVDADDEKEEKEDHRSNCKEDRLEKISGSVKRPLDCSENDFNIQKRITKKMKFDESSLPAFGINRDEFQQQISQLEEISELTTQISDILKSYGQFQGTNCESPQFIYAAIQTRIEDWKAGYLSTSYVVSKLKNCLETVKVWKQQVDFELPQEIENEEISADMTCLSRAETPTDLPSRYGNEALPTIEVDQQPPLPPDNTELFFTAPPPPPPPPIEEDPKPTVVSRSLISSDYGEDSDEEDNNEAEAPLPSCFSMERVDEEILNPVEPADQGTLNPVEPADQGTSNPVEPADQGTSNPVEEVDQGTLNLIERADHETMFYVESAASLVTKSPETTRTLPSDNKSAFSLASGVKKTKPLSTARLSVKKVSSLVEKWQKVQREL